jgi:hypothetical protein
MPAPYPTARAVLVGLTLLAAGAALGRSVLPPAAAVPTARYLEATVYLPLTDNAGRPFSDGDWDAAVAVLVDRFGGATLGDPQEGYWVGAGNRVHRERVRPVTVGFPPGRADEFRAALRDVGRRLGQEALYVRFSDPAVELIPVR